MARAYEHYIKVFGGKGYTHPDVDFITSKGLNVSLRWNGSEYRAYKRIHDGRYIEMFLGSVLPENLQAYIMKRW